MTQDTGHMTRDTGHKTEATGHRTQDRGHGARANTRTRPAAPARPTRAGATHTRREWRPYDDTEALTFGMECRKGG